MNVSSDQLQDMMVNIWTSVLGLPITPAAEEVAPQGISLTACVHITGAWEGALVLECPKETSRRAAAAMFGMETAEVSDAEMRDAVGELANVAGGNFKALLPGGCQLSLPTVVEGEKYTVIVGKSRLLGSRSFHTEGERVVLNILERSVEA
ncbi:MAG: chemotaxis protein CheX [Deltaproteobacteria bacterium]|nr:chemotaxis protein CheX [Deltaproteobacteria bacterium]